MPADRRLTLSTMGSSNRARECCSARWRSGTVSFGAIPRVLISHSKAFHCCCSGAPAYCRRAEQIGQDDIRRAVNWHANPIPIARPAKHDKPRGESSRLWLVENLGERERRPRPLASQVLIGAKRANLHFVSMRVWICPTESCSTMMTSFPAWPFRTAACFCLKFFPSSNSKPSVRSPSSRGLM